MVLFVSYYSMKQQTKLVCVCVCVHFTLPTIYWQQINIKLFIMCTHTYFCTMPQLYFSCQLISQFPKYYLFIFTKNVTSIKTKIISDAVNISILFNGVLFLIPFKCFSCFVVIII